MVGSGGRVRAPRFTPDFARWTSNGLHAAWLGHSTVLLSIDGFTILTDPVFSVRAGIGIGPLTIGVKRLLAPAASMEALPRIDLILLSHAHMDHFDIPSLRALESRGTYVVTAPHTSDLLRVRRYRSVQEVSWNEHVRAGEATVHGLEVNHWGARYHTDVHRGYNGYLVRVHNRQILFAGDTANTAAFRRLPVTAKPDAAIFPIGAYDPWVRFHCTPEEAWRMANDARAEVMLPVHHQTFALSREPAMEPIERLMNAAGSSPEKRIGWQEVGESFHWN